MTEDIDYSIQWLIDAHPLLLRGSQPAIPSGLPPGWSGLVDKLCSDIEDLLGTELSALFRFIQMKQKFAELRVYYRFGEYQDVHISIASPNGVQDIIGRDEMQTSAPSSNIEDRIRALVDQARVASTSICERCGAPGKVCNPAGWYMTLFDQHKELERLNAGRGESRG